MGSAHAERCGDRARPVAHQSVMRSPLPSSPRAYREVLPFSAAERLFIWLRRSLICLTLARFHLLRKRDRSVESHVSQRPRDMGTFFPRSGTETWATAQKKSPNLLRLRLLRSRMFNNPSNLSVLLHEQDRGQVPQEIRPQQEQFHIAKPPVISRVHLVPPFVGLVGALFRPLTGA